MTGIVNADSSPGPARAKLSKSESKFETTNSIARSIIQVELEAREAKTAKLRDARLAMEARQAEVEASMPPRLAAPKPRRKSAAKPKLPAAKAEPAIDG